MASTRKRQLRERILQRNGLLVPGAFNAMTARIVADEGFEAVYLTGAGLTNMQYGIPDLAFIGLRDVAEGTMRMRDAVDIPLIVDCDTGFGNAVNTWQTVKTLERAGADAIQLEDQTFPKRCGHFSGKEIAPLQEGLAKIQAAVDARDDPDLLIIARTDARAVQGFEAAVERAQRYAEAGADVLFIEAPVSQEEVRRLPPLFSQPLMINIVIGGKTPTLDVSELGALGYGIVLYPNAVLQGAVAGAQSALRALKDSGRLEENTGIVTPYAERQRLAQKPLYDALEQRYAT